MIVTNHLTASQTAHAAALEAVCRKSDGLQGSFFLSEDLNFDDKFPCFYLLYHPDAAEELISFLSVFVPARTEPAEIYAYTAPAWRRRGCFNSLLEAALRNLCAYGIPSVCFVHEPGGKAAKAVLAGLDTEYLYSEYLMKCEPELRCCHRHPAEFPPLALLPSDSADIPAISRLHSESFGSTTSHELICEVFSDRCCQSRKLVSVPSTSELLGICFYTPLETEVSVFGVAIASAHRRKGYGLCMLRLLLDEISGRYPGIPVTLQVSSRNSAAFALYQKLGFHVSVQFDYDYADCSGLLELF